MLDFVFTRHELSILDDVQPEKERRDVEDEEVEEEERKKRSVGVGNVLSGWKLIPLLGPPQIRRPR